MKFFLKKDLDENDLQVQFNLEYNFVRKALKVLRQNKDLSTQGTLSNLYHVSRRYEYPFFYNVVSNLAKENKINVLDIGAGTSYAPDAFSMFCESYTALDIIDYGLFWAGVNDHVSFIKHDISSAPLKSTNYDLVISISVLEHIPRTKRKAAIKNCIESIRKGGVFALSFDIDLEDSGAGLSFDELIEIVDFIEQNDMQSMNEIDLTTYQDLLTTEELIGLPNNRYQLPWRINDVHYKSWIRKVLNKVLSWEHPTIPKGKSLAVAYGKFKKI